MDSFQNQVRTETGFDITKMLSLNKRSVSKTRSEPKPVSI